MERSARQPAVIIVTPHFPPSTLAGVHRARHLAKHLPAHGWRPIILRVDEREYTETPDPELAALVPEGVAQVRVGAMPAPLMRRIGVGDIGLRAFWPIARALRRTIEAEKPEAVMITGSPYYPMMLARMVRRRFGLPVLLDFQDPWVSERATTSPLSRRAGWSKAEMAHRLALLLEPRAVREADFITSVSDIQNAEMMTRHAWLRADRMAAIPIGGDPEDFDRLRASPPAKTQVSLDRGRFNFSYVGTCLPRAAPLLRRLFQAIAALRVDKPSLAAQFRFNFVGTSNQPDDRTTYRVKPLAIAECVGDLVAETPQRVPFLEALSILANSDALLLIGSDEPHYTASKIYPALMSGRPFLSLFHDVSSAHTILARVGGGYAFSFGTEEELGMLVPQIAQGLARLASAPDDLGEADPEIYAPYTAKRVAGQFAAIFDRLASVKPALN
jgi:hypothetical protein